MSQARGRPGTAATAPGAVPSPFVRVVWTVTVILFVLALAAWGTTCTGPRPQPTGDTIPAEAGVSTIAP